MWFINDSYIILKKSLKQNELASDRQRHKRMPFVAGTVSCFFCFVPPALFLNNFDWLHFFLHVIVDESKPFRSCQHSKHPPHDEAPPAPAVWETGRPAQVWVWSQEKPPQGLFYIFCCFPEACQSVCRSVTELAVRPALGSAGWAWTHELVSDS